AAAQHPRQGLRLEAGRLGDVRPDGRVGAGDRLRRHLGRVTGRVGGRHQPARSPRSWASASGGWNSSRRPYDVAGTSIRWKVMGVELNERPTMRTCSAQLFGATDMIRASSSPTWTT